MKKSPALQRLGGSYQLLLKSADDLENVIAFDEAHWMATSVPCQTLTCDQVLLKLMDYDENGRIRTDEIRTAVKWVLSLLKNRQGLNQGSDNLSLAAINTDSDDGRAIRKAAERILSNLGQSDSGQISLKQVRNRKEFMAGSLSNGDGIISPEALDQSQSDLRELVDDILKTVGCSEDAGGSPGVNGELLKEFLRQSKKHLQWLEQGQIPSGQEQTDVMIWGEDTKKAYQAVSALREKLDQFFALCAVCAVDDRALRACHLSEEDLAALQTNKQQEILASLANQPIARPNSHGVLDLSGAVNPVFSEQLDALRDNVLLRELGRSGAKKLSAPDWKRIQKLFETHGQWQEADAGEAVAKLGPEKLQGYLSGSLPTRLQELIDQDLSTAPELRAIDDLEKLVLYQHWLLRLANNCVSFPDFYNPETRSLVEMGTLILDGRHFRLNTLVASRAEHKKVAANSHICLLYVEVSRRGSDDGFEVASAVTAGTKTSLCIGKPGIFFTIDGTEWDAIVVDVLHNPVSVIEAMKDPFRKLTDFISMQWEKITKSFYKDTEKKLGKGLDSAKKTMSAPPPPPPKPKAAGSTRDLLMGGGIAFAGLGWAASSMARTISSLGFLGILKVIGTVLVLILGTTLISALLKLRRRNLSMILEASGWAVNKRMRLTRKIGRLFTYSPPLEISKLMGRDLTYGYASKMERGRHSLKTKLLIALVTAAISLTAGYFVGLKVKDQILENLGLTHLELPAKQETPPE
jgi:hypothetical protein